LLDRRDLFGRQRLGLRGHRRPLEAGDSPIEAAGGRVAGHEVRSARPALQGAVAAPQIEPARLQRLAMA